MPDSLPVRVALWAPLAESAHAVVDGERLPMTRASEIPEEAGRADASEVWIIDLPDGTDYLLSIDGGEPRPDPRSRWQPHGVHEASRTFDVNAHDWSDDGWRADDVLGHLFYELHLGTFTPEGTLDAAIGKLGYLRDLGVKVVELMPVAAFPGDRGWGYDGVALYAVQESYGGPAALQRFVDAAHAEGLAVCLDVVYNHFGPAGNYAPVFAPYFTEKHHSPWGAGINLDDEYSAGVRRFIVDNALHWLRDYHIDALRLDAVHALTDDSDHHILAELSDAVNAWESLSGHAATLIAESDLNDIATVTPTADGGLGMDGQWDDDIHHALHSYVTGETFGYYVDFGGAGALAKAITQVFVHDGSFSTFRGKDWGTKVPDSVDRRSFVAFTQNHDQIGNRALGDRPDERLPRGVIAAGEALLLIGPFTPMLFQGQEWGTTSRFQYFTDHDPELGRLVSQGRTDEFAEHGWEVIYGDDLVVPDPQALSTFEDSKLDWAELDDPDHRAFLDFHRRLIELREGNLRTEASGVSVDHGEGWFRMVNGPLTVLLAPHDDEVTVEEARAFVAAQYGDVRVADGRVTLGPRSVVVLAD
ncbi:malto-oligosyltrehalose trehalohydrolase [Nigerium massiliense]|uniref:malto-oligosyltrehalose trehalohydrolase n=1 Tax=Nigerium massiliense TaxID=1522317 RepID=UPI00058E3ECE|nr:malto-oligosyltrehalose trehalohydrolase [Nigerium massiliense]